MKQAERFYTKLGRNMDITFPFIICNIDTSSGVFYTNNTISKDPLQTKRQFTGMYIIR